MSKNGNGGFMFGLVVLAGTLSVMCAGPSAVEVASGLISEVRVFARAPERLRGVMSEVVAVAPGPEMLLEEVVVAAEAPEHLPGGMPDGTVTVRVQARRSVPTPGGVAERLCSRVAACDSGRRPAA